MMSLSDENLTLNIHCLLSGGLNSSGVIKQNSVAPKGENNSFPNLVHNIKNAKRGVGKIYDNPNQHSESFANGWLHHHKRTLQ
jgi:hypothetical protein